MFLTQVVVVAPVAVAAYTLVQSLSRCVRCWCLISTNEEKKDAAEACGVAADKREVQMQITCVWIRR